VDLVNAHPGALESEALPPLVAKPFRPSTLLEQVGARLLEPS